MEHKASESELAAENRAQEAGQIPSLNKDKKIKNSFEILCFVYCLVSNAGAKCKHAHSIESPHPACRFLAELVNLCCSFVSAFD